MKAPWLVLVIVAAGSGAARADYDPEWRDGCPGGNLSRTPDVLHRASDLPPRYGGTHPELTGALPQADSGLARDQIGLDGTVSHFASPGNGGNSTSLYGGALRLHGNVPIGGGHDVHHGAGLGAVLSYHRLQDGSAMVDRLGSLVLEPEFRAQWVATGTNIVDSVGDPDHQAAGLRNGVALQAILAEPLDQGMAARVAATGVWSRDAFDGYLVSPRPTWGGALEIRSEGVGCYAPFVHLRLSLTFTEVATQPAAPSTEHVVMLAPQTLAFGFSPSSHTSVWLQYGLLVYFLPGDPGGVSSSLIGATAIHRFRFGIERVFGGVTAAAHVDFFHGSAMYDGTVVGVSLNWNLRDWR
jgi:hypothetical protein